MGTLVCRVELDKSKGMILTVENADGKITQTMVLDGTTIVTTIKGSDATSKITQKQDSVEIECKTFTLNAETITCKSKGKTHHESEQDFEIVGKNNIDVSATNAAKVAAMNTSLESKSETSLKGTTLKLAGTASAEMKGPTVTVEATGMMDVKSSGMINIKGTMVSIKDIVNMG